MKENICIRVPYYNSFKELKNERIYSIEDYTSVLRSDILRIITDVEDIIYDLNGNASKEDWDAKTIDAFNHVKHKLLDKANDIGRLPENICDIDDLKKESVENFIKKLGDF